MQQHGLAIRKFQRVVMMQWIALVDLPEDCSLVVDNRRSPRPYLDAPDVVIEGKFRPRKHANRDILILWRAEPASARVKLMGRELVADFRRPRFDVVKAVVTHLALLQCPSGA